MYSGMPQYQEVGLNITCNFCSFHSMEDSFPLAKNK